MREGKKREGRGEGGEAGVGRERRGKGGGRGRQG